MTDWCLDNQEVFNDVECDQTIIVELLEATEEPAIKDAVVHHFQEMASLNEARQSEVVAVEELTDQDLPHLKYFLYLIPIYCSFFSLRGFHGELESEWLETRFLTPL